MTRDVALLVLAPCAVQGVHQAAADEGTGVDHAGWPNEHLTVQAGVRDTDDLCGQTKENLVSVGELLTVVDLLDEEDTEHIGRGPAHVGHGSDDGVLLDIERAWVQSPFVSERPEAGGRKNPC